MKDLIGAYLEGYMGWIGGVSTGARDRMNRAIDDLEKGKYGAKAMLRDSYAMWKDLANPVAFAASMGVQYSAAVTVMRGDVAQSTNPVPVHPGSRLELTPILGPGDTEFPAARCAPDRTTHSVKVELLGLDQLPGKRALPDGLYQGLLLERGISLEPRVAAVVSILLRRASAREEEEQARREEAEEAAVLSDDS